MTEEQVLIGLSTATSMAVGWLIFRVARTWRSMRDEPLPPAVREGSHAVANEAANVQAGLKVLKKADDPFAELVKQMRQSRWG